MLLMRTGGERGENDIDVDVESQVRVVRRDVVGSKVTTKKP